MNKAISFPMSAEAAPLTAGETWSDLAPAIRDDAIAAINNGVNRYPDMIGMMELREALPRKVSLDAGQICKSLEVAATTGTKQTLLHAAKVLYIISASQASPSSLAAGTALLLAGANRLSYFNNFGLSEDDKFTVLPLSYDVPVLAALFLAKPTIGEFATVLNICFFFMAGFHVASVQIPAPGAMCVVILVFSAVASGSLVGRAVA